MTEGKKKIAVVSGGRGQDASYLAEFLLEKNYTVIAIDRRSSSPDYSNIEHLFGNPNYVTESGDITDFGSIARIVQKYQPDEFYNLAAMSFVGASWDEPLATCHIDFIGVCNCLEAIRLFSPKTKMYQASTSEVYGDVQTPMQDENTEKRPRSPYGAAKSGAEDLIKVYKDSYNLFVCWGRLFNHESPRRGKQFVTRKITNWIGSNFEKILSKQPVEKLKLGNLESKRDWCHAKDMVRGMWMMLQLPEPDNFVLASGKTWSIKQLLSNAFGCIGISNWEDYVEYDKSQVRPADVNLLCGDFSKAKRILGWEPTISFDKLIEEMVNEDVKRWKK
jgi:GDPmannose 4,6-dehydratase